MNPTYPRACCGILALFSRFSGLLLVSGALHEALEGLPVAAAAVTGANLLGRPRGSLMARTSGFLRAGRSRSVTVPGATGFVADEAGGCASPGLICPGAIRVPQCQSPESFREFHVKQCDGSTALVPYTQRARN